MKYHFSLVLKSVDVSDEDADQLYESGCDDASILSRGETTLIQFDRSADSLESAIASALLNVERAGFEVARIEIERDELAATA